jgi:hypothetical protein
MASKWLGRATTTDAPTVLRRRRHSTPIPSIEEDHVAQEAGREREQRSPQPRVSRPGRRNSLFSRARSLRGVKSLSDLKTATRKGAKSKVQRGSCHTERQDQAREGQCAVVRMGSVNSAWSAPLYFF